MGLRFEVLGWPADGPRLRLDYRRFSYAGKFVTPATGKAVARDPEADPPPVDEDLPPPADVRSDGGDAAAAVDPEEVVAAVAFNEDRTEPDALWFRYVTVRADRRGEGIGPRLTAFAAVAAGARGYDRVRIAVNNPFAYRALYKAGFAYTGRRTGVAELVLERPAGRFGDDRPDRDPERYRDGLDVFRGRDLSAEEESFLDRAGGDPPPVVAAPASADRPGESPDSGA